ncbi:MAG: F0F1 ATP synthase subunit gamma [Candidatus Abyssubacteria bacterium]
MQTEESLKRTIKTAQDLQSVVKTMKALAAVNIRQYEKAVESISEYYRSVELGLQVVLGQEMGSMPAGQPKEQTLSGAVVFGSDQGMCGQLNDQIVAHALETMKGRNGGAPRCVAIGLRVRDRLEYAGQAVDEILPVPGSVSEITNSVQQVLMIIEEWHRNQEIGRVLLFFSTHLSGASYRPHTFQLLPVDEEWLGMLGHREWPGRTLPVYTMERRPLFSALIRHYLFVSLYRAFAESLASENASRLASMQGAEKNIEDRLAELTEQYHRQRQMSITEELFDIVAGFEALKDDK